MNSEELRIYTLLTHKERPEEYRVSKDGTKLYVMRHGRPLCLEGENLDKMTPNELYAFHLAKLRERAEDYR